MAFEDSLNKKAVRSHWDLPILEHWHTEAGHPLTYFGLTGPGMLDLLAWKHLLDRRRDAVEELPRNKTKRDAADAAAATLQSTAMRHRLADGLEILRGDIGTIIIEGMDAFGARPQMSDGAADRSKFSYDLHNLDFDGGLAFIEKTTGSAPRMDAIKKLLERQRGHSFVLMLTVNVRNTVGKEIQDFLDRLAAQPASRAIGWYRSRGAGEVEHRLKAIVPLIVRAAAQPNGFRCLCYPPIAYTGHKSARMVHFCFELHAEDKIFAGVSHQQDADILALPMLEALDGTIDFSAVQHPDCVPHACAVLIKFLRPEQASGRLAAALAALDEAGQTP
jgi:hypothetical protein